jgi:hypothetical protein
MSDATTPSVLPPCVRGDLNRESITIMVHGTFAAAKENVGKQWWQTGSPFARKMKGLLPHGVRMGEGSEIFHWSGKNSERARSKAALRLLRHLEKQEAAGKDYHLVGHSHGGSVIWHALKLATLNKNPLGGLRSWTTVGTPFLQHRSRSALNPLNITTIVLAVALLFPFFRSLSTLHSMLHHAIWGETSAIMLTPDSEVGYSAVLRAPMIACLEYLGVPVKRMADGIHLGSYDPTGDVGFATYLFSSWEGLLLLLMGILHVYIGAQLIAWCITPALESRRIRTEARLEKHAYHQFGARWLGLWSRDDEAINGLRATLGLSVQFVGKMMSRERVFISDTTSIMSRPMFWLFSPLFNRYIQPVLDRFVRNLVIRSAQGNDRPTATLVKVTPTPLSEVCHDFAELPDTLNEKLLEFADRHASDLAPKMRRWLGMPSFASGMESFAGEISGHELIHTSYFDHEEIAALICCNIGLGTPRLLLPQGQIQISPELLDWFELTKRELSRNCAPDPIRIAAPSSTVLSRAA